jgi:hypothetical protein
MKNLLSDHSDIATESMPGRQPAIVSANRRMYLSGLGCVKRHIEFENLFPMNPITMFHCDFLCTEQFH